ncbi:response regulator transcription factor [Enterococcus avium]|jgi:two-component system, OmpR family, response regulator|uniref:response regulator transcription factor n=2 Tax=Enterococcus TaxID=1350 RepID=UPI000F512B16|nr:response regulator transcription factor [Enterococcus avium]NSS37835.1 response regulator transcription factor [Enterococcus faecalis]ROZ31091.1 DNA-binding response regulator [Enterococcus avium]HAP5341730.1 response regulator transcription factor [Enterococcus faecalis]HBC4274719.1 response regulator transcription factor [Enterococcus faecalis]HBC4440205.1 response regulator transcription factor [Enterococcus faecalis]
MAGVIYLNNVLMIDDDLRLCDVIKKAMATEDVALDFCESGLEGISKLKSGNYQAVVLDVMLPGMDGFETLRKIREFSNIPILMLTARTDSILKIEGFRTGADDYLTKPFELPELSVRILSLIRRYTVFNRIEELNAEICFDGLKILPDDRSVHGEFGICELHPKEYEILFFLAKNQGKILTKQSIYESVWKDEYIYDDNNIMAVISRLRKKLQTVTNMNDYIETVKGVGYRFNKKYRRQT